jgi:hypothetical protein
VDRQEEFDGKVLGDPCEERSRGRYVVDEDALLHVHVYHDRMMAFGCSFAWNLDSIYPGLGGF